MGKIVSVGKAFPPYLWEQGLAKEFVDSCFQEHIPNREKALQVYDNGRIEQRFLAVPFERELQERSFDEKNRQFEEYFIKMSKESILKCLESVNMHPEEVDHIVFVTSSGVVHQGVLGVICQEIQCRANVKCTLLFGLGCAGGAGGLARVNDLLANHPRGKAILCCVESFSINFLVDETSSAHLVYLSLFGDGAAAALLVGDELADKFQGPSILASESVLIPNSSDLVHIGVKNGGFTGGVSQKLPLLLDKHLEGNVKRFVRDQGITLEQVSSYIVHAGGKKILEIAAKRLHIGHEDLRHSWEILRESGNTASVLVLLILDELISKEPPDNGELSLMFAVGPGITLEQILLRW
ncbi:type III polyketide synthase [Thermoactinomyces sp. DSM 45892]|uniref:type III polyketide synthase n=1 Tax=Thermoactinomyces sp. DSM 45892 TaxID=1882753 RepID=UPI000897D60D|nr:3-oxoacyl-[acyl-carrier-protein] synthase III C-terminal domain-containing protein [Thermoactinomyces sp. DSM 45892]SDZ38437.1 alkylresorcinol/alkylpyrone synthase [Thermoactinomyces sp. DSM 45892]